MTRYIRVCLRVSVPDLLVETFSSKGKVRVLRVLVRHGALNINRICKLTGLHHRLVKSHLDSLVSTGVIVEEKLGKLRVYKINYSDPKVKKVAKIVKVLEGEV